MKITFEIILYIKMISQEMIEDKRLLKKGPTEPKIPKNKCFSEL